MTFSFRRVILVGLISPSSVGCAYRTPTVRIPHDLPAFVASEVGVVVLEEGHPAERDVANGIEADVANLLQGASTGGPRAQVTVQVDVAKDFDGLAHAGAQDGCGLVAPVIAAPTGLAMEEALVSVDLSIESEGRSFHGRGTAEKSGSVYAHARRRALALALNRALIDATPAVTPARRRDTPSAH